tara:strand:+ start:21929 stop:22225 length:297 start_codon:yes stop_codon:yes gene_type:complete
MSKLILLTEVHDQSGWTSSDDKRNNFMLREVVVNPNYVVIIREDDVFKEKVGLDGWPSGLDERVSFCKITINSGSGHSASLNVIGDLYTIAQKFGMDG